MTQPLVLDGDVNDVRPQGSGEMEWWWEVAVKWTTATYAAPPRGKAAGGEGGKVVNPMNQTPKTPFSGVMDESAGAKEMKRGDSDDSGGVRVSTMKVSDRKYSYDGSEACESKHEWG